MSRVTTTNYGAAPTTIFQWATTDDDLFDREFDIYNLSQAVELHDHSSGRGLPVARLAAGAVDSSAVAALAIQTTQIAGLAVTNAKLAAGAVTMDKITFPLIQPTNDMAGGYRQRETSNTYAFGMYMALNGLMVIGSGTIASIPGNLVLGQAGQVSVGTTQGGALFNIMQVGNVLGSGLRVYNTNTAFYSDIYNEAGGFGVLSNVGVISAWWGGGKVSIGNSNLNVARLNIAQSAGTLNEGLYINFGAGTGRGYIDASGHLNLQSALTNVMLMHTVKALAPLTDNDAALGQAALRWTNVYTMALTSSGAISGTTGTFSAGVSGSTLSASAGLSVGSVVSHLFPSPTLTWLLGNSTFRYVGGHIGIAVIDSSGIFPFATMTGQLGSTSNVWSSLSVDVAAKTGGGSFSVLSDDRLKDTKAFRPYDHGLETLLKLEPTYYRYSGEYNLRTNQEFVGFRAQQLQKVVPEMVETTMMQKTEKSKPVEMLMVNDSQLPYILLNAIKELNDRITALEDRKN